MNGYEMTIVLGFLATTLIFGLSINNKPQLAREVTRMIVEVVKAVVELFSKK